MSPKIGIVPASLERGATEVHVIGTVVSGAGHRILSLPTPYGLPDGVKEQLQTINLHLQHSGVVLAAQRHWLRERAKLALRADAPDLGSYTSDRTPLLATDPHTPIDGFDREKVLAAGGLILRGGGHRIKATSITADRHKGDDWLGDDDRAASNLDAVEDDARGDAKRLAALDAAHDRPLPKTEPKTPKQKAPDAPADDAPPPSDPPEGSGGSTDPAAEPDPSPAAEEFPELPTDEVPDQGENQYRDDDSTTD